MLFRSLLLGHYSYLNDPPSSLTDISPLKGMGLITLDLWGTPVTDLTPIETMKNLKSLTCPGRGLVIDLSFCADLKLTYLDCTGTRISDISPLASIKTLTILKMHRTLVTDLTPLQSLPLRELICKFVPEGDTKVLRSIKTLETINGLPAKEFWKRVEAGDVPQAK